MSISTHIGIYLEIPHGGKQIEVITYKHPITKKEMKTRFCPNTGVEGLVSTRMEVSKQYPDAWIDGHPTLDEEMFSSLECGDENTTIFVLNKYNRFSFNIGDAEYGTVSCKLNKILKYN